MAAHTSAATSLLAAVAAERGVGAVVLYDKLYLVPVDASGLVQLFRHEFADFLHVLPFAGEGPGNRRHEADFDGGGKGE